MLVQKIAAPNLAAAVKMIEATKLTLEIKETPCNMTFLELAK